MPVPPNYFTLEVSAPLEIHHLGPPVGHGPLPTLIYFAISGYDTLTLDPFNQPALFFAENRARVLSFDLPLHGKNEDPNQGMQRWAEALLQGSAWLDDFLTKCRAAIEILINEQIIDPNKLAVAGLSRGGFVAAHLAGQESSIGHLLGFAPLTRLSVLSEFSELGLYSFDLKQNVVQLQDKIVRCYIGNRDERVSTAACFEWIHALTEASYKSGHRSPPIELILTPSIGHKGHGTGPDTFRHGIQWLKEKLSLENN